MYLMFRVDSKGSGGTIENAILADYARHSLREMCAQEWLREKLLRDPESLLKTNMLRDAMLSPKNVSSQSKVCCMIYVYLS